MSWILKLEDTRVLRDSDNVPADLLRLLTDAEARIRRRAALAIGRVGLSAGVMPLVDAMKDPEPEVRQMAAFAIGLIGDRSGRDALIAALNDPSLLIRASAAEALASASRADRGATDLHADQGGCAGGGRRSLR